MDGLDQVFAQGFSDSFGLRMNLQLGVDIFEVERYGVGRDAHLAGGGLLVMAFDEEFE